MQKKKSNKKINKTFNTASKREEGVGVKDIMKEIGQLKKELVSIKSKKYLHIREKDKDQQYLKDMGCNTKRQQEETVSKNKGNLKHFQTFNEEKENVPSHQCTCQNKQSTDKKKNRRSKQPLKIQILHLSSPKSRSIKLKVNIELNKIKSILQKLHLEIEQTEQMQVLVAELNTTIAYIDSSFNEYEYQLGNKKSEFKALKSELSQISENVIKLAEKYSNEKNMSSLQVEQIGQLKRYISYYLHLMKDSKEQAQKYSKQLSGLEQYIKQLESNNGMLRKQIKQQKQNGQKLQIIRKQMQRGLQMKNKQFALMEQDMGMLRIQSQKNRDKRKQVQKRNNTLVEQLKQIEQKHNYKQYQRTKIQAINKQLQQTVKQLKQQSEQQQLNSVNKTVQMQRLFRQLSVLKITYENKEKIIIQQDQQLITLRQRLQKEIKDNKRLTEGLEFSEREIDNLSQEIDSLKQANERYKNKHFRNKLTQAQTYKQKQQSGSSNQSTPFQNKSPSIQEQSRKSEQSHKKNRQKILGEIQELIEKHKRQSDSDESEQEY